MWRLPVAVAFTAVFSLIAWGGSFLTLALGWNWLMIALEGKQSECTGGCKPMHEFTYDHDLVLVSRHRAPRTGAGGAGRARRHPTGAKQLSRCPEARTTGCRCPSGLCARWPR